jgi:hypothetical protein
VVARSLHPSLRPSISFLSPPYSSLALVSQKNMPSEYNLAVISEPASLDPQQQGQTKLCSQCHTVVEPSTFIYVSGDGIVCSTCQDTVFSNRNPLPITETRSLCTDADLSRFDGSNHAQNTRRSVPDRHEDTDVLQPPPQESDHQYHGAQIAHTTYVSAPLAL